MNQPQLGIGQVRHTRLRPARNAFAYPTFFLLLPMRSLRAGVATALPHNRRGALSFWDADHGDGRADSLAWLEQLLQAEGIHDADGEVWLQTFPRILGYVHNSASFWFCHRKDGALRAVLAEVNSTHGTRHCYLLEDGGALSWGAELRAAKAFHVSQLSTIEGGYRFRFLRTTRVEDGEPVERIVSRVDYHDDAGLLIQASISGNVEPMSDRRLAWAFFRYPLMTVGVFARIHWQAFKMIVRRVPFYGRSGRRAAN